MPAAVLNHGVYYQIQPTAQVAVVEALDSIVAVGTAPVHMLPSPAGGAFSSGGNHYAAVVNQPILAFSYADAVGVLNYTGDWANFTLCEVMDAAFIEFNVAPLIFVNVLDPEANCTVTPPAVQTVTANSYQINVPHVIYSSVIVQNSGGSTTYVLGTDYVLNYNTNLATNVTDNSITITLLSTGSAFGAAQLKIGYSVVIPGNITGTQIVGGVTAGGVYTGLQVIDLVFPKFGLVPAILICPGFSQTSTVAAAMLAAVQAINSCFYSMAIVDVDSSATTNYSQVASWKTTNNIVSRYQILCWPKIKLGAKVFWMSTQEACLSLLVDFNNNNLPFASPSNNNFVMDSPVISATSGQITSAFTTLLIPQDIGNYLNSQGVVTAIQFGQRGWVSWGNYTAAYPGSSDPSAIWIPVLRMFLFFGNTTILTCFQFVDNPGNLRLIEVVEVTMQQFANALVAVGALLGGSINFLPSDNPISSLLAGTFTWRAYLGGVIPAQNIQWLLQFNTSFLATLFSGQAPS